MNNTKTSSPNLKKEWSKTDFKTVETAIYNYFKRKFVETLHNVPLYAIRSYKDVDNCFGFAYTSTGSFAMLSICNTEVYFDYAKQWQFVCFGLAEGHSGFVYALLYDDEENEIYFPIN